MLVQKTDVQKFCNVYKCEIYCFAKPKEKENDYRTIFGYEVSSLPFIYMGIPIHYRKFLKNGKW
jgi:hypothetical protein